MKKDKNDLFLIAVFALILVVPLLCINRQPGTLSETENRMLAGVPKLLDEQGRLSPTLRDDVEDYFNDNIGFREQFVRTAVDLMTDGFGLSPNQQVHIGEDGWYFYTGKYELEIPAGRYPIYEYMEALDIIASTQQGLSDYYAARGIDYVLVLMPCKASIYPEYIGGADFAVGETPIDLVYDYLKAHTDVHVVNVKDALIAGKPQGKQFLQHDTHWTALGSYNAYREIISYMANAGLAYGDPVDVTFTETPAYGGNLLNMMGSSAAFPAETITVANWDARAHFTEDDLYTALIQNRDPFSVSRLTNDYVPERTLMCYTDSQWTIYYNLPQLFAEHFSSTASIYTQILSREMEDLINPDVVIFTASEQDTLDQLVNVRVPEQ